MVDPTGAIYVKKETKSPDQSEWVRFMKKTK